MPRRPLSREPLDRARKRSSPSDCGSVRSRTRFIVNPSQREPSRADTLPAPTPPSSSQHGRGVGAAFPTRVAAQTAPATPARVGVRAWRLRPPQSRGHGSCGHPSADVRLGHASPGGPPPTATPAPRPQAALQAAIGVSGESGGRRRQASSATLRAGRTTLNAL